MPLSLQVHFNLTLSGDHYNINPAETQGQARHFASVDGPAAVIPPITGSNIRPEGRGIKSTRRERLREPFPPCAAASALPAQFRDDGVDRLAVGLALQRGHDRLHDLALVLRGDHVREVGVQERPDLVA